MAEKKDKEFDARRPLSQAGNERVRESTPSGVKIASGAHARPLAAPRAPAVDFGKGQGKSETPTKSGVAESEIVRPSQKSVPKTTTLVSSRHRRPEAPQLSASDVEWWAESTLNTTFDESRVVAIDDPNDPSYGDRITPVFLESITPVFPESKVREVMALADAVEAASSVTMKQVPAIVAPLPVVTPVAPPVAAAVMKHVVWQPAGDVPVAPKPAVAKPAPGRLSALDNLGRRFLRTPIGQVRDGEASDDLLHAVTLASKGSHIGVVIWIAMALVVLMVVATMFTVG